MTYSISEAITSRIVRYVKNCLIRFNKFKIRSEHYRNRGKRLGFRFTLIAGINNLELNEK